jgi:tetratricopeptide (TPR) repeat protein
LDDGIEAIRFMLARIGIKLPETRWQIYWTLAWGRFRNWLRGVVFRERCEAEIPPDELDRIDLCYRVGATLALADAPRGWAFHVRYFYPMALKTGEPGRVALAFGMAAVGLVIRNGLNAANAEKFLERAHALAKKCNRPFVRAMVTAMDGCTGLLMGQWKRGYERSKEADEIFTKECTSGVAWERGVGFHYMYTCLLMRGQWKQCAEELPALVRDALDRGDLFTATSLQIHSAQVDLANDDPQKAKQTIAGALNRWPARGFHLQHHHAIYGDTNACLYSGEFAEALQIVHDRWPALKESMLLQIQEVRVAMVDCRAHCTIAASMVSKEQGEQLLRAAERDARSIAAERMPYTDAIATLLFASIAYRRGRVQEAIALLEKAIQQYEEGDMLHVAASVRWRLGELLGDKAADHIDRAREFLEGQGIRNPVRFLNIHTAAFSAPP